MIEVPCYSFLLFITEFLECKIDKHNIQLYKITFMTDYLSSKCFYINYV